MQPHKIILIGIPIVLFLAGCASGSNFAVDDVTRLEVGKTTREGVESMVGKPLTTETVAISSLESIMYFYGYARNNMELYTRQNHKNLNLEFVNNVLNGFMYNNSFDDNSTDFDGNVRNQLVNGQSTKAQAHSVCGKNAGEIRIPTNLLKRTLPEEYSRDVPSGAKLALIYYYNYAKEVSGGGRFGNHFKVLVLYFDSNNILLDKIYFENIVR